MGSIHVSPRRHGEHRGRAWRFYLRALRASVVQMNTGFNPSTLPDLCLPSGSYLRHLWLKRIGRDRPAFFHSVHSVHSVVQPRNLVFAFAGPCNNLSLMDLSLESGLQAVPCSGKTERPEGRTPNSSYAFA